MNQPSNDNIFEKLLPVSFKLVFKEEERNAARKLILTHQITYRTDPKFNSTFSILSAIKKAQFRIHSHTVEMRDVVINLDTQALDVMVSKSFSTWKPEGWEKVHSVVVSEKKMPKNAKEFKKAKHDDDDDGEDDE